MRERRLAGEHHVIAASAVDFEKSQRGLGEVAAVATLGVAGQWAVLGNIGFSGLERSGTDITVFDGFWTAVILHSR